MSEYQHSFLRYKTEKYIMKNVKLCAKFNGVNFKTAQYIPIKESIPLVKNNKILTMKKDKHLNLNDYFPTLLAA